MNPELTWKIIALFNKELVTANEAVNWLLFQLVCDPEVDTIFLSSLDSLPIEITQLLLAELKRIHAENFVWTPHLIGGRTELTPSQAEISQRLRNVCLFIGC